MKKTLYINLFGSPGTGKSTGAAYIFSKLKMMGMDCEYIGQFAKDKCWQGNKFMFDCPENQFYIGAKQFYRVNQIEGKVDVAITDSPIFLNSFYNNSQFLGDEYNAIMLRLFNKFDNMNFFLQRTKGYNPNGRNQSKEESDYISLKMKQVLNENNISYMIFNGDSCGYEGVLEQVVYELRKRGIYNENN